MSTPRSTPLFGRRLLLAFALLGLAASQSLIAAETKPAWRVGVGREKITPQEPLWMTGYAARDRPAEGTAQDLWVKALAFEDHTGKRGVLLTADLCGITREISDHVAQALERSHQIPRSAVMTNISHTHCSPAIHGGLLGIRLLAPEAAARTEAYTQELKRTMIRAATAALDSLAPAALSWSEDEATFGINRRNNTEKDAPALRAAGKLKGPSDPRVPVLAVRDAKGELRAVFISYACHNTTLMLYQWHGDYAGVAQAEIERRHPGAVALFAIGCGADINPNPRRELAHAEQHGRALADAADRALQKPMQPIASGFKSTLEDITLTFSRRPTEAQIKEAREKEQPNKEMYQAWAEAVTQRFKQLGDVKAMEHSYPIQAWKLGDISWVALGGEVVVDYALRLREQHGKNLWVFGYSTDVMAYIPNERVLKEGRYEGDTSMVPYGLPGPWNPGLEEKIVTKTDELLSRLK